MCGIMELYAMPTTDQRSGPVCISTGSYRSRFFAISRVLPNTRVRYSWVIDLDGADSSLASTANTLLA